MVVLPVLREHDLPHRVHSHSLSGQAMNGYGSRTLAQSWPMCPTCGNLIPSEVANMHFKGCAERAENTETHKPS